ncbi:MAG: RidA family protein [Sporomusaceae bacterium]|jgi:2-iminobutanoate/2-iminopropanoate deaminase|nr:RidA family protein [Sporomusaceae bacterium]
MKKIVHSDQAPAAIGPYSQAVSANGFLFISGQIPLDAHTGQLVYGNVETQAYQVLNNLKAILSKENLTFDHVVKTTIFLKDMADFDAVNKIYAQYFTQDFPARVCVAAAKLPKDVTVEIDAIAVYDK